MPPTSPSFWVKKRYLPQARVTHDTVGRHLLNKLGVVIPAGLGTVTTGHQEEMADWRRI